MTEEIPNELRKKYIPMTETTYYTLLAVISARHGYAIMQFVSELTKERIKLGTGTLYTMVARLTTDGLIILINNDSGKKTYQITKLGMALLNYRNNPFTDTIIKRHKLTRRDKR